MTVLAPGTKAYDEPLAERRIEAWHYLGQWAIHGEVLFAINALAERQAQQAAPAVSPSRTATWAGRRCLSSAGPCLPPPASTTLSRRRTGIHPWTFPAWN